ncbi:MAG: hypothetical protein MJY66_08000 [Bacteroidaceae bacterium]|nr:hypothetical protein [Bacteroidaceae bacterium]
MKAGKIIVSFLLGCLVSGYVFPFNFSFLPASLNTKQMIGVLGIIAFAFYSLRTKTFNISKMVIGSALFALAFSVWCYFSMVANETNDTTYAEYWISFAVWLGGAFGVISLIRLYHGSCNLKRITDYLAGVCFVQCWLALAIDHFPGFQMLIDTYIQQGQEFLHEVGRMYGIGCALDPAGVRFSVVLVLIAHQIGNNLHVTDSKTSIWTYLILYSVITIVGNMISRTTIVGAAMGLVYMFMLLGFPKKGIVDARQLKFYSAFLTIVAIAVAVSIVLYRTSNDFRNNIRFAFEGFFNLFETGEFRTGSTDKLNAVMWIWPTDFRSWVIGTGLFGGWVYSTDIGYCRFTLYCGLVGLAIFSAFFIYNGLVVNRKFKNFILVSLFIISMTFVIWIKVATDLFFLNAILFCIDGDYDDDGNEIDWYAAGADEAAVEPDES